jgi:hypothetical protein
VLEHHKTDHRTGEPSLSQHKGDEQEQLVDIHESISALQPFGVIHRTDPSRVDLASDERGNLNEPKPLTVPLPAIAAEDMVPIYPSTIDGFERGVMKSKFNRRVPRGRLSSTDAMMQLL